MKLLFLTFHYLGPLFPIAQWLAERGHEVLYASSRSPNLQKPFSGALKRVILKRFTPPVQNDTALDILENGVTAARNAEKSFLAIRESGFTPDIVFSASSGGAALAIPSVFPDAYWLNFVEPSFGRENKAQVLQNLQFCMARTTHVFYQSQKSLFPEPLRGAIGLFNPVVNASRFVPDNTPRYLRLAAFFNLRDPERIIGEYLNFSSKNRAVWIVERSQAKQSLATIGHEIYDDRCQIASGADPEEVRRIFCKAQLSFFEFPGEMQLQAMACQCASFAAKSAAAVDLPGGMIQVPASGKVLSDLLNEPRFLVDYAKKGRQTVLSHFDVAGRLPDWFEGICRDAAAVKEGKDL